MSRQVQKNSNDSARFNASFHAPVIYSVMLEPTPLPIDVHRIALVVLAQHRIPVHVNATNSNRGLRVRHIFVDAQFPVVDATRESHGTDGHAVFPSLASDRLFVVQEQQVWAT